MFTVVNGLGQRLPFDNWHDAHKEVWRERQFTWANIEMPNGRIVR